MSTRQVASLLAAAAPEVVPPRDTLRAVAPDRYTLKVTIDQECEQGLRLLKDLMSHLDPRMSWGDLVARMVRETVTRHDPRGGGNGQRRRRSAGSAGASPRRTPNKTRATGAAAGPAQRASESSGRRRTGPAPPRRRRPRLSAEAATLRRRRVAPPLPEGRPRSRCWPTLLHRVSQGPPHFRMAPAHAALNRGALAARRARRYCGAEVRVRRLGGWLPCRRGRAGHAGRHFGGGAGTRRVPRRRTERRISRSSGAPDPRTCSQPPPIPAAAPHSRGCPAPRLATRRWTLLLSRSAHWAPLHLFPSAADRPLAAGRPRGWSGAVQPGSSLLCSSQNASRLRTGYAAGAPDVVPPPRCCRAAGLRRPTARRWHAGTHFAAPRAGRASSLPPHQTLAGRCRCARARRCCGLPSTNSCRLRRFAPTPRA